jgi:tetratricopeptide (TPR) repeat protein
LALNLGLLLRRLGQPDRAIASWREYLGRHPDALAVKAALAQVLADGGETAEARRLACQILQVQPGHAEARAIVERAGGQETR